MNEPVLVKSTLSRTDVWLHRIAVGFTLCAVVVVVGFFLVMGLALASPSLLDGY